MPLHYRISSFFALACAISWVVWAPLWLPAFGVVGLPVLPFHHALGAFGPLGAAFILCVLASGWAGPADLLRRMVQWRACLPWLLVALLAPFFLLALALAWAWAINGEHFVLADFGRSREFPQFPFLLFLAYNILTFGFGEEAGWRGYALPRLQARYPAWATSLGVALGWALWHLPLFFYRPGYVGMGVVEVAGWLFSLLTGSVLLTWLYNQSRGSLLVVAIFHATVDVAFTSAIASPSVVNSMGALITFWGIGVLVWSGPRNLSSQGRQTA